MLQWMRYISIGFELPALIALRRLAEPRTAKLTRLVGRGLRSP